ncbi:MAG: biopolymer transporter ExbD [Verrucomicrobiota bacterium]
MASSSKLRAAKGEEGEALTVDMSPMIDMVFLLLLFFLVNATIIIVKTDPKIDPPVAKNSRKADDGTGRIVINIRENGDLYNEQIQLLADDDAVKAYVKAEREVIEVQGYEPKLHLRGDRNAVFKHCRRVLRLAASEQVDRVLFSTYGFDN